MHHGPAPYGYACTSHSPAPVQICVHRRTVRRLCGYACTVARSDALCGNACTVARSGAGSAGRPCRLEKPETRWGLRHGSSTLKVGTVGLAESRPRAGPESTRSPREAQQYSEKLPDRALGSTIIPPRIAYLHTFPLGQPATIYSQAPPPPRPPTTAATHARTSPATAATTPSRHPHHHGAPRGPRRLRLSASPTAPSFRAGLPRRRPDGGFDRVQGRRKERSSLKAIPALSEGGTPVGPPATRACAGAQPEPPQPVRSSPQNQSLRTPSDRAVLRASPLEPRAIEPAYASTSPNKSAQ